VRWLEGKALIRWEKKDFEVLLLDLVRGKVWGGGRALRAFAERSGGWVRFFKLLPTAANAVAHTRLALRALANHASGMTEVLCELRRTGDCP